MGTGVSPHGRYLASHELSEAGWEGQRGDEKRHQGREEQAPGKVAWGRSDLGAALAAPPQCQGLDRHLLLHEEAVDGLLPAHELHDLAVEVDKECTPKAAGDPGQRTCECLPSATTATDTTITTCQQCLCRPRAMARVPGWPHSPNDGEGRQLLQVEGEVKAEAGFEQRRDRLWGMAGVRGLVGGSLRPPPHQGYLHPCSRQREHGR